MILSKNKQRYIYIFLPSFENGGISKITTNLINFFLSEKRKVMLFSFNANIKIFKNTKNLRIFNYKKKNKFIFSNLLNILFLTFKLSQKLKNGDIVLSMQNHFFLLLLNFYKKNKIIIRNSEEIFSATRFADNKLNGIIVFIFKLIFYQFAHKIIAISKLSKNSLERIIINKQKIKLIYNPYIIKINRFKPKFLKKKFLILSTGRLVKQKNFELLIDVVKKVREKREVELLIIGNGNREKILKKRISNSNFIKIINWKKDLSDYYKRSNLYIMSSFYEGSPNVLLDSINNSTPILASNCSGVGDIIGKNKGYIFKNNDEKDLYKKLLLIIDNYNLAIKRSKLAHKNLKKFSINNSKNYLKIFN